MLRSFNLPCTVLVLFVRLLIAYGSAYFDDWACSLLLCCNEFLLVVLSKLGLLLRADLYSFPMGSVNFCSRFLFLGFWSRNKRKCRSCKGYVLGFEMLVPRGVTTLLSSQSGCRREQTETLTAPRISEALATSLKPMPVLFPMSWCWPVYWNIEISRIISLKYHA
jgi:hypothetical protein